MRNDGNFDANTHYKDFISPTPTVSPTCWNGIQQALGEKVPAETIAFSYFARSSFIFAIAGAGAGAGW